MRRRLVTLAMLAVLLAVVGMVWYGLNGCVSQCELRRAVEDESQAIQARLDTRCDALGRQVAEVDAKIGAVGATVNGTASQVKGLEAKLDRIEAKLDRLLDLALPRLPDGMKPSPER